MSTSPVRLTLADNLECDRFPDIDGTASRERFRALVTDRARQTWQDVDVQWGDATRAESPEDSDLWRDLVNDEHDRCAWVVMCTANPARDAALRAYAVSIEGGTAYWRSLVIRATSRDEARDLAIAAYLPDGAHWFDQPGLIPHRHTDTVSTWHFLAMPDGPGTSRIVPLVITATDEQ